MCIVDVCWYDQICLLFKHTEALEIIWCFFPESFCNFFLASLIVLALLIILLLNRIIVSDPTTKCLVFFLLTLNAFASANSLGSFFLFIFFF